MIKLRVHAGFAGAAFLREKNSDGVYIVVEGDGVE
jgi:hypothetical protein